MRAAGLVGVACKTLSEPGTLAGAAIREIGVGQMIKVLLLVCAVATPRADCDKETARMAVAAPDAKR